MCGQFIPLDYDRFDETVRALSAVRQAPEEREYRETVYPSQQAETITTDKRVIKLTFGIKTLGGDNVINAREERIRESRMFSPLLRSNRCVIPAQAYYEWLKIGNKRYKYKISGYGGDPLLFAGLYGRGSFVIITTACADSISFIHPRMPRCLTPDEAGIWLGSGYPELILAPSKVQLIPARV